jgi:hypothetical protein
MGKRGKTVDEKTRQKVIELRRTYSVSYIARHVNRSKSEIYKILRQERKRPQHFSELSATALKLAEILDWYYKQHRFTIDQFISSDFPYTTHTLESPTLNEQELSNLLAHLKGEIPEMVPIGEYPKACEQWFALGDRKWEKETPTVTITGDLILKLKLKANQANFIGRCPDCPR